MTDFLGTPVEDLAPDNAASLALNRDRADAYALLRKASVPFLGVELVLNAESEEIGDSRYYKEFFEAFRRGGMPKPMDFASGEPLPSDLNIQIRVNKDVEAPYPAIYGKDSEYLVLKQLSRTHLIRDAHYALMAGYQDNIDGEGKLHSDDDVTEDDAAAIRRSRLTILQFPRVLHELLDELLHYHMDRARNPLLKTTNLILQLHQERYPEADVFELDKIQAVHKRVTAFLHYNDNAEQWLADDKDYHTNETFKEWRDALPFDNDIIHAAISRHLFVWARDNPLKHEIEPFVGIVGHAIRGNLRLMRQKTPLADNGGKPLSIRRMAERLGTKPLNLSRLETGKKSALYPIWIRQYARVLGCKEVDFFPTPMVGLILAQPKGPPEAEAAKQGPIDQELIRQLPGGGTVRIANEQEERLLELNRRLFEEREVEFQKEKQELEAQLSEAKAMFEHVAEQADSYRAEIEETHKELDAARNNSMKLMEEIIELKTDNEKAFAGLDGKPVNNSLPVYGQAFGGQFSDVVLFNEAEAIDYVGMPYNLVGVAGAFAVMCAGNSMSPKFESGDILHVHPHKRIRRGHYIVVEWEDDGQRKATVGRYVNSIGNEVTVEKLNPVTTVDFTFQRIFRIIGSTEAED